MNEFSISSNVPLPGPKMHHRAKYPFVLLNIGDSFFVPNWDDPDGNKLRSAMHSFSARRRGLKFQIGEDESNKGWRVWRLDDATSSPAPARLGTVARIPDEAPRRGPGRPPKAPKLTDTGITLEMRDLVHAYVRSGNMMDKFGYPTWSAEKAVASQALVCAAEAAGMSVADFVDKHRYKPPVNATPKPWSPPSRKIREPRFQDRMLEHVESYLANGYDSDPLTEEAEECGLSVEEYVAQYRAAKPVVDPRIGRARRALADEFEMSGASEEERKTRLAELETSFAVQGGAK